MRVLMNPRLPAEERARVTKALESLLEQGAPADATWVSTSGSTAAPGESKWVALTPAAIRASAAAVNQHLGVTSADVWIHALPKFHVGGIGIHARAELAGIPVVEGIEESWSAARFHAICEESGASLSALVPAQIHDLVQAGLHAPTHLRAIVIGGGALAPSLWARAQGLGWPLLPSYGLSECASQVATARPSTGRAPDLLVLPHVQTRLEDDECLAIRSSALLAGYGLISAQGARWQDPKINGWLLTEDRAGLTPGNAGTVLKMLGRRGDFLKVGGESVDLAKLEALLAEIVLRSGDLLEAALVPVPDSRLGHYLQMAIHVRGGASDQAAREAFAGFNAQVLPFERARKLALLPEPLPRSPLGKILRAALIHRVQN